MTRPIVFLTNHSSWDYDEKALLPGSMMDLIVSPIARYLAPDSWSVQRYPVYDAVNVYGATRNTYGESPGREIAVHLGHGIADKGDRAMILMRSSIDYVILPSHLMRDTLIRQTKGHGISLSGTRVPVLGMPKLDPLFNGEVAPLPRDERPRVLYAPTQGGGDDLKHMHDTHESQAAPWPAKRTSWWRRDEVLSALDSDEFDVVVCPHPRYTPGHVATLAEYVNADVVIADGGSTLWEALALGIPLVVTTWISAQGHNIRRRVSMEALLYAYRVGRHAQSRGDLAREVRNAVRDGVTPLEREWSEMTLRSTLRGTSGKAHADWLTKIAEG